MMKKFLIGLIVLFLTGNHYLIAGPPGIPPAWKPYDADTIQPATAARYNIRVENLTVTGTATIEDLNATATIDDATSSTKGILSADSDYFTLTAGALSLGPITDDTCIPLGTDSDVLICWDSVAAVLEFRDSAGDPFAWLDPANKTLDIASVASPEMSLFDSDGAGADRADKYAGGVAANFTTTTEDAETSDLIFYGMIGGSKVAVGFFDGSAALWDLGAYGLGTTGTITGGVLIVPKTAATYTLGTDSAREKDGAYTVNADNDAFALTLPAQSVGMSGCLGQGDGVSAALTLDNTAQYFVMDGIKAAQGEALVSSGSASDQICWICLQTDIIKITSKTGTWAEETPP